MTTTTSEFVTVGPFTWERREQDAGDDEAWDLVLPKGLKITRWVVKNYGGKPTKNNAFSGWRLVSGGPFTQAGGWTNRDDAMRGVIPYLLDYIKNDIVRRTNELAMQQAGLAELLKTIDK